MGIASENSGSKRRVPENTRDLLMAAAKKLFARQGFNGTTVKDIVAEAGVNVSLVSYHFGGKEGLYEACLEQFGAEKLAITVRMLQPANSVEEFRLRLGLYFEELMNWYVTEPEVCTIIWRDSEMCLPVTVKVLKQTFMKVFRALEDFLGEAQKKGFIRQDLEPEVMAAICSASLSQFSRTERISRLLRSQTIRNPDYRRKVLDQVQAVVLDGIASRSGS